SCRSVTISSCLSLLSAARCRSRFVTSSIRLPTVAYIRLSNVAHLHSIVCREDATECRESPRLCQPHPLRTLPDTPRFAVQRPTIALHLCWQTASGTMYWMSSSCQFVLLIDAAKSQRRGAEDKQPSRLFLPSSQPSAIKLFGRGN